MITNLSQNHRTATCIEEMQQVAQNQITFKIYELEERIQHLKTLAPQVNSIVDQASFDRITADAYEYGDAADLTALVTLGEYYECMQAGNYF